MPIEILLSLNQGCFFRMRSFVNIEQIETSNDEYEHRESLNRITGFGCSGLSDGQCTIGSSAYIYSLNDDWIQSILDSRMGYYRQQKWSIDGEFGDGGALSILWVKIVPVAVLVRYQRAELT